MAYGKHELVNKRCEKCHASGGVSPRTRRCKQIITKGFGKGYWCYGKLSKIERKTTKRTLEQELERAHAQMADALTRVKRAVTSVNSWQLKIKRLGRRIDERDHPQPKAPKARKRTRIITLPDDPICEHCAVPGCAGECAQQD